MAAAYLPIKGELDPQPLMQALFERGCGLCLPVIGVNKAMSFHRFTPGDHLKPNRYGIPEPDSDPVAKAQISLMLVPLVAFDHLGTRLGMGAGYYDRFLTTGEHRPLLIGLAHALQQSSQTLRREPWDVPLNAVITELGTQWFD